MAGSAIESRVRMQSLPAKWRPTRSHPVASAQSDQSSAGPQLAIPTERMLVIGQWNLFGNALEQIVFAGRLTGVASLMLVRLRVLGVRR
jgi:hypothetical protein